MNILLHCCCGPCACGVIPQLQQLGHTYGCFFYNPNIHPYQEHKSRKNSFIDLMEEWQIAYYLNDAYPLEQWLAAVAEKPQDRCQYCYQNRLQATAALAKRLNYDAFSTTLLVSPYQNQERIREIGQTMGEKFDIPFFFADFRPGFRSGQALAREKQLYMQKYCGCIYSEKERYCK